MNKRKTKTPEEISEWLKSRKWINAFARNMREVGKVPRREAIRILAGEYLLNTIAGAFDWGKTRQGSDYWLDKHKELLMFYYHG